MEMHRQVQYLPFLALSKNNRTYSLLLPLEAPYEDAHAVCLELGELILEIQKKAQEESEKIKLSQEVSDAKAEAEAAG